MRRSCSHLGGNHFGPLPIKSARCLFTIDVVDLAGEALVVGAIVTEAHRQVQFLLTRFVAAQYFLDLEPVLAVVLLENSAGTEGTQNPQAHRIFDFGWRVAIDQRPRPDLDFTGSARMPDAQGLDLR